MRPSGWGLGKRIDELVVGELLETLQREGRARAIAQQRRGTVSSARASAAGKSGDPHHTQLDPAGPSRSAQDAKDPLEVLEVDLRSTRAVPGW